MNEETLVYFGDEVKAVTLEDGNVKLGGYLVRFGDPSKTDLTGDYFTANTHFGDAQKSLGWLNHRLPIEFEGKSVTYSDELPEVTMKKDDIGIFAEIILGARNAYEKALAAMGLDGKLSWSSGTAAHLVDRKPIRKGVNEITRWILGLDASLTPTPAEYRNVALPMKSLFNAGDLPAIKESPPIKEEYKMDELELNALLARVADDAAKKAIDSLPTTKAGTLVEVVEDEADRALKGNPFSKLEFFTAVKNAAMPGGDTDKRLFPLKATGMNEAVPSAGGFLIPTDIASGIQENMWGTGSLLSRFNPIPVTGNRLIINSIDETSRSAGYRWGGIRGYWLAEAGTKTASRPKFRQIDLVLKKVAALCWATDELLDDASALESWLTTNVPNELRFMVEDAILINGNGAGMPLSILNSPALVSAVRTDASEVDPFDIARMWAARYPGANDYIWTINSNVVPQLLNMTIGQMPAYLPPGGLSGSQYGTLLGRPVIETEYNPSLGTLGDILLFSPSQYAMITKGGIQSASSIHVNFIYDETAFRFVYRVDGQPAWASAVSRFAPSTDSVSPYVALAAST